jgi:hypothetical protein
VTAPRVSIEALLGAADWLRAYEIDGGPIGEHGPGDDERAAELLLVAEWLDAEVARRQEAALERTVARRNGVSLSNPVARRQVRAAIARSRQEQQT